MDQPTSSINLTGIDVTCANVLSGRLRSVRRAALELRRRPIYGPRRGQCSSREEPGVCAQSVTLRRVHRGEWHWLLHRRDGVSLPRLGHLQLLLLFYGGDRNDGTRSKLQQMHAAHASQLAGGPPSPITDHLQYVVVQTPDKTNFRAPLRYARYRFSGARDGAEHIFTGRARKPQRARRENLRRRVREKIVFQLRYSADFILLTCKEP